MRLTYYGAKCVLAIAVLFIAIAFTLSLPKALELRFDRDYPNRNHD